MTETGCGNRSQAELHHSFVSLVPLQNGEGNVTQNHTTGDEGIHMMKWLFSWRRIISKTSIKLSQVSTLFILISSHVTWRCLSEERHGCAQKRAIAFERYPTGGAPSFLFARRQRLFSVAASRPHPSSSILHNGCQPVSLHTLLSEQQSPLFSSFMFVTKDKRWHCITSFVTKHAYARTSIPSWLLGYILCPFLFSFFVVVYVEGIAMQRLFSNVKVFSSERFLALPLERLLSAPQWT